MKTRRIGNQRYICRIDQHGNSTHGWYLRIMYNPKATGAARGVAVFFSDKKYGGKRNALLAATAARDSILGEQRMVA